MFVVFSVFYIFDSTLFFLTLFLMRVQYNSYPSSSIGKMVSLYGYFENCLFVFVFCNSLWCAEVYSYSLSHSFSCISFLNLWINVSLILENSQSLILNISFPFSFLLLVFLVKHSISFVIITYYLDEFFKIIFNCWYTGMPLISVYWLCIQLFWQIHLLSRVVFWWSL